MSFTFSEFFAGTGLVSHVFSKGGGTCIFANDLDERKAAIYTANHGTDHFVLQDITKLKINLEADGSWGSFPCTDASSAKGLAIKRKADGLKGKATSLFWHWIRVAVDEAKVKPKWLVGENVTALLHHPEDCQIIVTALRQRGYKIGIVHLELADFRPMRRSRIFILATRVGHPKAWKNKPGKLHSGIARLDLDFWPQLTLPRYEHVVINYSARKWRRPTARDFSRLHAPGMSVKYGFKDDLNHRVSDKAYCVTKGKKLTLYKFTAPKPFGFSHLHKVLKKRMHKGTVTADETRRLFGVDASYVMRDADVAYGLGDAVAPDHAKILLGQFIRPIQNPFLRAKRLAGV